MAYRVFNDSNNEGSYQVKGTWRVLAPHSGVTLEEKPQGVTAQVKIIAIKQAAQAN